MVAHVVLYRPKPGLGEAARDRFLASIDVARREIGAIRRFTVGRRIHDGPTYRGAPFPDFPYMAAIEFDDREGLAAYLAHPMHAALGQEFGASLEAALVYDYEVADAADAAALLTSSSEP